jgi:hopanoid biosynthesis associated RND transporter like protein HpnN
VIPFLERMLQRALSAWISGAQTRAVPILVGTLGIAVVAAFYTSMHLEIDTDDNSLFDDSLPHRVIEIEYQHTFPNLYENIVILVDAENAEQARKGALQLAERLEAAPELFSEVYLPRSEFLEEHALLYMETEDLEDLVDRLARVQPYLASLARDGTLRGLAMMLARGVRAFRDGDVDGESLFPMLARVDAALRAQLDGGDYRLSWGEVVAGHSLTDESTRRLILVQPIRDLGQLVAAGKSLRAVRQYAEELGLTEDNGVRVRMTGDVALAYEEMQLVDRQATAAGIASFILVGGLLFFALRSLRVVASVLLSLVVGLILTGAFATVAIGHLNLLSVAFAVLFIGLGVDFGVHLCMGYQEQLTTGRGHADALQAAASTVGGSLGLCAFTTAIGFYAFIPTDFSGVAELGLISGTGMFISLFCTFTVLPALLSVGQTDETARRAAMRARMSLIPDFPVRHPVAVCTVTGVVALCALALLPSARFDQNPLLVRDPSAESVQAFEELLTEGRTSPWSLNALAPDLESAERLAVTLQALDSVEDANTVEDYVPTNQVEKLAIIEDVAIFLAPRPRADGTVEPPTREEVIAALVDFRAELSKFERLQPAGAALPAVFDGVMSSLDAYLATVAVRGPDEISIADLETSLLATLPAQLESLERSIAVGPITLDTLPGGLVDRMISADGQVRVQIFPSRDLTDPVELERFVTEVRGVAPRATGSAVAIYAASSEVVQSMQQAFTMAIVAIAVLLFVIWRAFGDMAMVMAPLTLAGLLTAAGAVAMGIPFNFADVIVLPLLLGIGVDSSIHLVHRARTSPRGEALLETSTANAVVWSAATTIGSFGSLALATHRGMASLGQLLALGVTLTVVCNVVVLPALLELRSRLRNRRPVPGQGPRVAQSLQ